MNLNSLRPQFGAIVYNPKTLAENAPAQRFLDGYTKNSSTMTMAGSYPGNRDLFFLQANLDDLKQAAFTERELYHGLVNNGYTDVLMTPGRVIGNQHFLYRAFPPAR